MTRPPRLVVVGSGIAGLYAALIASDAVLDGGPACEQWKPVLERLRGA